jgi:cytochrome c-type biogenesis protein CcmH
MRRLAPWLALFVLVAVAAVFLIARSAPSDAPDARAKRLEHELACPVCTGEALAESNAPEARAMKAEIPELIGNGLSDDEIKQHYVEIWGERILLRPENDGIALIAWGLPVIAIILGAAGIAFALRRWSSQPRLAATADDEVEVERARRSEQAPDDA